MPDDIIQGKCDDKDVVQVQRCPAPPRFQAPPENVGAALNMLERAERPLILVGKGMAWANAESEVRSFIEKTQVPFLRSPMGKGVMSDDHPLSVSAARTLASQNADVVFLMGARFNWIGEDFLVEDMKNLKGALLVQFLGAAARLPIQHRNR